MRDYAKNEKYIFVSYSHKDSEKVIPIIETMCEAGFRTWYDQSIEVGTEWPAYIEEHLTGCETFLVFMSENTVESLNCRNEISLAVQMKKKILVVYLEATELRRGLALQLGTSQSLSLHKNRSKNTFFKHLFNVKSLLACFDKENYPLPVIEDDEEETDDDKKSYGGIRPVLSDEKIIDLYWQRDQRAITETDHKYRKFLYTVAYNIIHDRLDCEECLNDTYLGTWNRIPPERPNIFRAFLARITRNIAVDRYRKKAADKRIP